MEANTLEALGLGAGGEVPGVKPEVETQAGRIRGSESGGIRSFKGIRYAGAPEGAFRFLPPTAPEPWTGVRDATAPGPAAPQYALPLFGWISAAGVAAGEDCLSLNVWTPGLDDAKRPVLVWIHGGGFVVGAGSTGIYDGHDLALRGDVVVVTINYRLGALGYAHLGTVLGPEFEQSTNLGVRDQIAALEWVRDNIDRFGGDPGNVTVFGQSAGAMSIGALLGAPRARPLFRRAVCMSGAADHVIDREDGERAARQFLRALGGPAPSHEVLGRIPLSEILRAQSEVMSELGDMRTMMVFLPCVDGDVIPEQPLDAVRSGATADTPLLIGATLDEWRLFRLVDPGPTTLGEAQLERLFAQALSGFAAAPDGPAAVRAFREAITTGDDELSAGEVWSAFQTARMMHFPAARLAEAQAAGGGAAHNYLFTWRPPALRRALGACHGLDIPFVFGAIRHPLILPLVGLGGAVSALSRSMQSAWVTFAREGVPGDEALPAWPTYCAGERRTMVLGRRCEVAPAPLERERGLLAQWAGEPFDAPQREGARRG